MTSCKIILTHTTKEPKISSSPPPPPPTPPPPPPPPAEKMRIGQIFKLYSERETKDPFNLSQSHKIVANKGQAPSKNAKTFLVNESVKEDKNYY